MSPNDLDQYLGVLAKHKVAQAAVELPNGVALRVVFTPDALPEFKGETPTPGGWKYATHLDNPDAIDPGHLGTPHEGVLP